MVKITLAVSKCYKNEGRFRFHRKKTKQSWKHFFLSDDYTEEYKVLVATRVGEEGLDISEVNLVIFYDNVPSSIRYIQRRGRTGRKDTGKLIVLIARDTIDETYYWIGKRKINASKTMGEKMTQVLQKKAEPKAGLDAYL